jgi:hypothetical protein
MTHPSLEEDLDETNFRDTHPWEILDSKMSKDCHRHRIIETNFLPIDIHDETPMELEKLDYIIDEHGRYFMNASSNPCSYEKSPELTSLSNIATYQISNPLMLRVHKNFEWVVVDAYVYHKYCRSCSKNLE